MTRRFTASIISVLLPISLGACSSPTEDGPPATPPVDTSFDTGPAYVPDVGAPDALPPDVDAAPFTPPGSCDDGTVHILRVAPWLGGGVQLTLELTTPDGGPATEGNQVSVVLRDEAGGAVPAAIRKAWQGAGLTGVVLVPSADAAEHAARVAGARALIEGLPAAERVALWVGAIPVRLGAELTEQRDHVLARLDSLAPEAGVRPGAPQLAGLRQALAGVEGEYGAVSRHLVIVDGEAGAPDESVLAPVLTRWVVAGAGAAAARQAGASVAEDIIARRYGIVRVGACPSAAKGAELTVELEGVPCTFTAPEPMAHMVGEACDPGAAADDDYPYPDTVEFVFTDAERAIWEARKAADSKDDFRGAVRLGAGTPIPATIHLRGHTSLFCERRNYNVNLDGGEGRRLMPGSAVDQVYLISMCKDDGYFNQTFAGRLLQAMGLYPLAFKYVRLLEQGDDRGAYIVVEQPSDALVQDHLDLAAVIRRRFDPEDQAEDVKFAKGGDDAKALARYEQVVDIAQKAPPEELIDRLSAVMDLDGYLRWLAFMTFMVNGDYVDEIYFYGAVEEGGEAWFRMANWDPDDLFSACHHGSKFAHVDPAGILYCSEGKIDEALLRSPAVYARYIEALEQVMEDLTAAKIQWAMDQMRDQLFAVVSTDASAAAMIELQGAHPETATAAGFQATVQTMMDEMRAGAEASRKDLKAKIAAWKATR